MAECAIAKPLDASILTKKLTSVNYRWFELGERLGVKYDVLQGIQKTHQAASPGELMIHMLESWLKSSTTCSWNDIIQKLEDMDEMTLAEKLKKENMSEQPTDLTDGLQSNKHKIRALLPTLPPLSNADGAAGCRLEAVKDDFDKYGDLKSDYAHLLTRLRQYLETIDLKEFSFFLGEIFNEDKLDFTKCDSPDVLIELIKKHINLFNISPLEQILGKFQDKGIGVVLKNYRQKKEHFLCTTYITDFSNTTPGLTGIEMCKIQFNVAEAMDNGRTLKDIVHYAQKAFGRFYEYLSEMMKEPCSEFIVWSIPKTYAPEAIRWAQTQLEFLNRHGVNEISVGDVKICSCSQPNSAAAGTSKVQRSIERELQLTTQRSIDLEKELLQTKQSHEELQKAKQRLDSELQQRSCELEQKRVQLLQANKRADENLQQASENEQIVQRRLRDATQAREEAEEQVQQVTQQCLELQQQLKQAIKEKHQLHQQNQSLEDQIEQKIQQEIENTREIERMTRENQLLTREVQQWTSDKEHIQNHLDDTEKTLDQVIQQLQQAREREQQLNQQLTESSEQIQQLRLEVEQVEQIRTEETQQHARDIDYLQMERKKRQEETDALRQQLSVMTIAERSDEQPHWVVRREEVELTEELVGRGGWGEVKVARFCGIRVAAKVLHTIIISNYNRQQFTREMTITARLRHPNILLFIGATIEGEPIILTELMHTSLRKELEVREMPQIQIISISQNVACALRYLHQLMIIHRDISSSNVLLEPIPNGWRAKVSDYGSANFMNVINTVAPGNPAYAAPEAHYPDQHSPKMDTFSFGILLIEMCIQEFPETNPERREQTILRILWPAIVSLIRSCTSAKPADRPNMSQVMDILNKFLSQL